MANRGAVVGWRPAAAELFAAKSGKSTVAAARAVGMLMAKPGAQVLMTAPSQRQSGILFRAAIDLVVSSGLELNAEAWNKSHH